MPSQEAGRVGKKPLVFEPIARSENPPHEKGQEQHGHGQTDINADVSEVVEAPAEAANQIEYGLNRLIVCQTGGRMLME